MAVSDSNVEVQQPDFFKFTADICCDIWEIHNHALAGRALVCSAEGYDLSYELMAVESMFSSVIKNLKVLVNKIDQSNNSHSYSGNKSTEAALEVGSEESPEMLVMEKMKNMTDDQKNKFVRYSIRLLNNDPKLKRLTAMYENGEITIYQLMEAV